MNSRQRHLPSTFSVLLAYTLAFLLPLSCASAALWIPWIRKSTSVQGPTKNREEAKVVFEGFKIIPEKKLRTAVEEQLRIIQTEGLNNPNADDAAYYTSAFYQDNGFASVDVTWEIRNQTLFIRIKEGAYTHLRTLRVSGNHSLQNSDVIAILKSPTIDRLGAPDDALPFVLEDLRRGGSRLIDWYQADGFLHADIENIEVSLSHDSKSADVHVIINEGQRYRYGQVQFRGDLVFPLSQIQKVLSPLLSEPYSAPRTASIQSDLLQLYRNNGYFLAEVDVSADPSSSGESAIVPVIITVKAGTPYHVRGFEFHGLSRTRPSFMQARLLSLESNPYNAEAIEAKSRRLMASGLFSSLKITPQPTEKGFLKLRIDAEEAKARELGFSGGFGSYDGFMLGVRVSDRNLFGKGLQGGLELGYSQRALSAEFSFANPWLFETQTEFISRLFLRSRLELGYDKSEGGIRAELARRLFPDLRGALYGQSKAVEITSSSMPPESLGKTSYQVATIGASATLDKRNDALNPTKGWIAAGILDSNTLENGTSYLRSSARLGWHLPLPWGIGLAASGRFGMLSARENLPIDERFFLGGATTVRSFRERELGPHDSRNYPTGGGAFSLLNIETDFPLLQSLKGALFFDAGSLSPSGQRVPVTDFGTALGVGLRYALPVGPIRLDFGFNPKRKPSEDWGAVHLSFGFAF